MNERDFVYFLQGFAELNGGPPDHTQWKQIQDHLSLVLNKVTPSYIEGKPMNSDLDLLSTPFYNPGATKKYC